MGVPRKGGSVLAENESRCESCEPNDRSPGDFRRHLHWLTYVDQYGMQKLKEHLEARYGEKDEWKRVGGILEWVRTMRLIYNDRCDDNGVPIPVSTAWMRAHLAKKEKAA